MKEVLPKTLADYVRYVLKVKNLTHEQVEARSGGEITHSYISKIKSGVAVNLTSSLLVALGRGLGVDPVDLFKVSIGRSIQQGQSYEPRSLQAELYFSNLPEEQQDDALRYLQTMFGKYGQKPPTVMKSKTKKRA
jgi:transcriptional regulator with XRE-family HTH domain